MNGMSALTPERVDGGAVRRAKPRAGALDRPRRAAAPRRSGRPIVRGATAADTLGIQRLITTHADGHLLARTLCDLTAHATRFLVATVCGRIVGCAELAPLSSSMAEIRSFVVRTDSRGLGLGRLMIDELRGRARTQGFDQLCAFTHAPAYFAHLGFASVPHTVVPEKIAADCRTCPRFGTCGQYAMVTELAPAAELGSDLDFCVDEPERNNQDLTPRFLPMV
jgi:N-acetylglutamate synthase-like GNAT family acetyltransferase